MSLREDPDREAMQATAAGKRLCAFFLQITRNCEIRGQHAHSLDSPHRVGVVLGPAIPLLGRGRYEGRLAPSVVHLEYPLVLRRIGGGRQHVLQHAVQLLEPGLRVPSSLAV